MAIKLSPLKGALSCEPSSLIFNQINQHAVSQGTAKNTHFHMFSWRYLFQNSWWAIMFVSSRIYACCKGIFPKM